VNLRKKTIKNVCLYSGEDLWEPIIDHFKSEKIWDYVMWLAPTEKANYKTNKSYMSEIDHETYRAAGEEIYNKVYEYIYTFTDMYSRNSKYGQNKFIQKQFLIHKIFFNRNSILYQEIKRLQKKCMTKELIIL